MSSDLLPGESIYEDSFSVGDKIIYKRVDRGGYGLIKLIDGVVVAVGKSKITIEISSGTGGTKRVLVQKYNLHKKDGAK